MRTCFLPAMAIVGVVVVLGCSQDAPTTTKPTNPALAAESAKYLLKSEPADAVGVIKTRKEARDQDEVVIVGRIGGSEIPWVEGRAAFSIVDSSLESCAECGSDNCPKPWDY